MELFPLALIGGIWLSLLYSATVMPATVWVIQLTVSRGWLAGLASGMGLAMGQLPWCLVASLLLFQKPRFWQFVDPGLRLLALLFLGWMAVRSLRARPVQALWLEVSEGRLALFRRSLWRSLMMPWRFPLWIAVILSVGIHLRGPGWPAALFFTLGAFLGQLAWHLHFMVVAGLFGRRVPEDICLHSMNKLRFLGTIVLAGLGLIIIAPLALMV